MARNPCFKYAIAHNKGNVEECCSALQQIVPHAFRDHENCLKTWCGYVRNSDTYKHSTLPYGKDLSGKRNQQNLEAVFSVFANNAEKMPLVVPLKMWNPSIIWKLQRHQNVAIILHQEV